MESNKAHLGDDGAEGHCTRVRLAEGNIASVEACGCGSLQLHLGAVTLRFTPDALSSLMATLMEASAAYAARREQLHEQAHGAARPRGQA